MTDRAGSMAATPREATTPIGSGPADGALFRHPLLLHPL